MFNAFHTEEVAETFNPFYAAFAIPSGAPEGSDLPGVANDAAADPAVQDALTVQDAPTDAAAVSNADQVNEEDVDGATKEVSILAENKEDLINAHMAEYQPDQSDIELFRSLVERVSAIQEKHSGNALYNMLIKNEAKAKAVCAKMDIPKSVVDTLTKWVEVAEKRLMSAMYNLPSEEHNEIIRFANAWRLILDWAGHPTQCKFEGPFPTGPIVEVLYRIVAPENTSRYATVHVMTYEQTPKSTENFTKKFENGDYNEVAMHRVIPGFCIQGGDPTATGRGGESIWGATFEDEIVPGLKNKKYTVSMANAGPGTNGSQFFFNMDDNSMLNGKHSVFGIVVDPCSQAVLEEIQKVPTDSSDRPVIYENSALEKEGTTVHGVAMVAAMTSDQKNQRMQYEQYMRQQMYEQMVMQQDTERAEAAKDAAEDAEDAEE